MTDWGSASPVGVHRLALCQGVRQAMEDSIDGSEGAGELRKDGLRKRRRNPTFNFNFYSTNLFRLDDQDFAAFLRPYTGQAVDLLGSFITTSLPLAGDDGFDRLNPVFTN